jgi:23S rRNA pseudouridine1911/1915/1917 synthase
MWYTMSDQTETYIAGEGEAGQRLDVFVAACAEDASRSYLQRLIKEGRVLLNGEPCTRPSHTVRTDDAIAVTFPPPPVSDLKPEDIPLDVLFEDADVLIVNKPSGLVVHPAPGHATGTLVNAVLHHCRDFQQPVGDLSGYGEDPMRPGIVHRLDRFTSGVMVVAKTQRAFNSLSRQAREHTFDRHYLALVRGRFKEDSGLVDATIGRSLSDRGRMNVTSVKARRAVTRFEVLEPLGPASLLRLTLETGRTHQIRVHMRFIGHPILGDPVYGITDYAKWIIAPATRKALKALKGQALHAELLGIEHPVTGERMKFTAPPPPDFQAVWDALRLEAAGAA